MKNSLRLSSVIRFSFIWTLVLSMLLTMPSNGLANSARDYLTWQPIDSTVLEAFIKDPQNEVLRKDIRRLLKQAVHFKLRTLGHTGAVKEIGPAPAEKMVDFDQDAFIWEGERLNGWDHDFLPYFDSLGEAQPSLYSLLKTTRDKWHWSEWIVTGQSSDKRIHNHMQKHRSEFTFAEDVDFKSCRTVDNRMVIGTLDSRYEFDATSLYSPYEKEYFYCNNLMRMMGLEPVHLLFSPNLKPYLQRFSRFNYAWQNKTRTDDLTEYMYDPLTTGIKEFTLRSGNFHNLGSLTEDAILVAGQKDSLGQEYGDSTTLESLKTKKLDFLVRMQSSSLMNLCAQSPSLDFIHEQNYPEKIRLCSKLDFASQGELKLDVIWPYKRSHNGRLYFRDVFTSLDQMASSWGQGPVMPSILPDQGLILKEDYHDFNAFFSFRIYPENCDLYNFDDSKCDLYKEMYEPKSTRYTFEVILRAFEVFTKTKDGTNHAEDYAQLAGSRLNSYGGLIYFTQEAPVLTMGVDIKRDNSTDRRIRIYRDKTRASRVELKPMADIFIDNPFVIHPWQDREIASCDQIAKVSTVRPDFQSSRSMVFEAEPNWFPHLKTYSKLTSALQTKVVRYINNQDAYQRMIRVEGPEECVTIQLLDDIADYKNKVSIKSLLDKNKSRKCSFTFKHPQNFRAMSCECNSETSRCRLTTQYD